MHLQFKQKSMGESWPEEWIDADREGSLEELQEYAVGMSDPGNNHVRFQIVDDSGLIVASIPAD